MLLLWLACTAGEDTGPATQDSEPTEWPEPEGCDEVGVGFDGADPPHVGDTWTVWPTCDGDAVMGGTVIRVTPVEMAYQDGITLTWEQAGEAEIMAQTGPDRAYLTVTVQE